MELFAKEKTLPKAYHRALMDLYRHGEKVDCTDWNTTCLDCSMTMVVEDPLAEPFISKLFIGGPAELQQYVMEMLDGILDFEVEKGNWAYTYHNRMVNYDGRDQIKFVIDELKRNPSSRRAVIVIRNAFDIGSDDPACLQHIQFFANNGRLDMKVLFRSNDACKASFMNAFALIMLQKRVADKLGIPVGTYTHRANSYHCYEKDYPMLVGYVERIENRPDSCVAVYEDDWKEMMEEAIPAIQAKVEELKNRDKITNVVAE